MRSLYEPAAVPDGSVASIVVFVNQTRANVTPLSVTVGVPPPGLNDEPLIVIRFEV